MKVWKGDQQTYGCNSEGQRHRVEVEWAVLLC
jgi:hypothetical protein